LRAAAGANRRWSVIGEVSLKGFGEQGNLRSLRPLPSKRAKDLAPPRFHFFGAFSEHGLRGPQNA
jgi:hypothetical protein